MVSPDGRQPITADFKKLADRCVGSNRAHESVNDVVRVPPVHQTFPTRQLWGSPRNKISAAWHKPWAGQVRRPSRSGAHWPKLPELQPVGEPGRELSSSVIYAHADHVHDNLGHFFVTLR